MNAEHFYPRVQKALQAATAECYLVFSTLHAEVLVEYTAAVRAIDTERAALPASDGRTLQQVVGHIMEWDRYMLQAAGEILSGINDPQMMSLKGFHALDGTTHDFGSIDEFNAFQAEQQHSMPWQKIQQLALDCAERLYALFTTPELINPTLLDATASAEIHFTGGEKITSTTGWQLWMIILEHEGVEHAPDLMQ